MQRGAGCERVEGELWCSLLWIVQPCTTLGLYAHLRCALLPDWSGHPEASVGGLSQGVLCMAFATNVPHVTCVLCMCANTFKANPSSAPGYSTGLPTCYFFPCIHPVITHQQMFLPPAWHASDARHSAIRVGQPGRLRPCRTCGAVRAAAGAGPVHAVTHCRPSNRGAMLG